MEFNFGSVALVLFFLAMFIHWATTLGALSAAVASVAAAVGIAFSKQFGLGEISILWITPGSFAAGVVVGGVVSLLPIGPRRAMDSASSSSARVS